MRITIELQDAEHLSCHSVSEYLINHFEFDPLKYPPLLGCNYIYFTTSDGEKFFIFRLPKKLAISEKTKAGKYRLDYWIGPKERNELL
jgi:hypothetical protein